MYVHDIDTKSYEMCTVCSMHILPQLQMYITKCSYQYVASTASTHSNGPEVPHCYRLNVSSSVMSTWSHPGQRCLVIGTDHIPVCHQPIRVFPFNTARGACTDHIPQSVSIQAAKGTMLLQAQHKFLSVAGDYHQRGLVVGMDHIPQSVSTQYRQRCHVVIGQYNEVLAVVGDCGRRWHIVGRG